jgi:hypothetical protein
VIGRPPAKPPIDAALRIEQLAAGRYGVRVIAMMLRVNRRTVQRWFQDYPELAQAFEWGRAKAEIEIIELLWRDACNGAKPNVNAIFLAKCLFGYREGEDHAEQASRVNITFNLPGPMTREDFLRTVAPEPVSHARND